MGLNWIYLMKVRRFAKAFMEIPKLRDVPRCVYWSMVCKPIFGNFVFLNVYWVSMSSFPFHILGGYDLPCWPVRQTLHEEQVHDAWYHWSEQRGNWTCSENIQKHTVIYTIYVCIYIYIYIYVICLYTIMKPVVVYGFHVLGWQHLTPHVMTSVFKT